MKFLLMAGYITDTAAIVKAAAVKAAWYNQRRLYRQLRRNKCSDYWRDKLEADQAYPRRLWKSVDSLLGRGRQPASSAIDVALINRFFADKVEKVRLSTASTPPPTFRRVQPSMSLRCFSPVSGEDVISAIQRLLDKSSAADPLPTTYLKQVADVIAPFVVELFYRLLAAGHFPACFYCDEEGWS